MRGGGKDAALRRVLASALFDGRVGFQWTKRLVAVSLRASVDEVLSGEGGECVAAAGVGRECDGASGREGVLGVQIAITV